MDIAVFGNLPVTARAAYAVMCFERYAAFRYPEVDFKPVAEIMWHIVDGSKPFTEAAELYPDILAKHLFAYSTYEDYRAAGHSHITEEQYHALTGILNPDDRYLNDLIELACYIMTEYKDKDAVPGVKDTLPYLKNITAIMAVRMIELPELSLLQQYACPKQELFAVQRFNWMGGPIDPAPLSLFGIQGPAGGKLARRDAAARSVPQNKDSRLSAGAAGRTDRNGSGRSFDRAGRNVKNVVPVYEKPLRPVVEANGCKWEIIEGSDGCIITQCRNKTHQTEITVPSELNGMPVVEIDDRAFSNSPENGCLFIEKLILPDTILRIGDDFFTGCTGLRQITMPAMLERLGSGAFRGASRLESLRIGDHCRIIGDYFCTDAVSLRSVMIGAGTEYIGEYTFYNTPAMNAFHCDGILKELGYGSFWMNRWADKLIFHPAAEMLRFCKDGALLYRYVKKMPPPRLFFDASIRYVYDFAFGGDAWNSGSGISDIYLPGAEKIGVNAFKKTPNATVHLSASRMLAAYGQDYEYTLAAVCKPARIVFDQP